MASMSGPDSIPLEPTAAVAEPSAQDKRPKMPEPLPVRLIAVADVALPAQTDLEKEMDRLYLDVLGFQRDRAGNALIYQADNFRLILMPIEGLICRVNYRPAQIEVPSLAELEAKLIDYEIEYMPLRGLLPGSEALLVMDPSGNYLEITDRRKTL